MSENTIIYAIVTVAVLALVGRLLIKRKRGGDNINWGKLIGLFGGVVAFVVLFTTFNPHRAIQWWKGEVMTADAQSECIAGRKAGKDITRFAGPNDDRGELYYALQVKGLEETGYYRIKTPYAAETQVERDEKETESNMLAIERKTSMFPIRHNPSDNIDQYMPIYMATLENKGKVLVAMESEDAKVGELPVGMMRLTDEKLKDIALKSDSTAITDYYFILFDEARWARNSTNYYFYKGIAGVAGAIVVAFIYLIFSMLRKKKR